MKSRLIFTGCLLAALLIASSAFSVRPDRAIVGRWFDPEEPGNFVSFSRNGMFQLRIDIPIGLLEIYGTFTTRADEDPKELDLIVSSIMLDGRISDSSMLGNPGDMYRAIYSVEVRDTDSGRARFLTYQMNRDSDGLRPASFDDPVIYIED